MAVLNIQKRKMEIAVKNHQKKILLNCPQISKITKTILHREKVSQASLSIVFVTYQKIKALNKKFLKRSYATDVLAFDGREGKSKDLAGDIIISTDAAIKNTKIYETTLEREIIFYVIHGILHLLGFDDHKPSAIKKMRKKEQELLKYLGTKIKKVIK